MTESKETAAERAIREALESVERIEREGKRPAAHASEDDDVEQVRIVGGNDQTVDVDDAAAEAPARKKSASDALLEATIKAKQEMAEVLAQTQKEAKDLFDRLARVSADFDNFKKRVQREKADAIKFGNEGLLKDMLPVVDNLGRALASGAADDKLVEGVRLVLKQFEDALSKAGVVGFTALGEVFDPARHEAVGSRPDDQVPAQHVCEEYQRGYMLHDRLLRPALVIVSTGGAAQAAGEGAGGDANAAPKNEQVGN